MNRDDKVAKGLGLLAVLAILALIHPTGPYRADDPLTNEDIVSLVEAGMGEAPIVLLIEQRGGAFDLSPEALVELKSAGVSDKTVEAMLKASKPEPQPPKESRAPQESPPAEIPAKPPVPVPVAPPPSRPVTTPPPSPVGVDCSSFDDCMQKGRAAVEASDWEQAKEWFEGATSVDPASIEAWDALGRALVVLGSREGFEASWDRVLDLGGTLELDVCVTRTMSCDLGSFRLETDRISFTSEKHGEVFAISPKDVGEAKASLMRTSYSRRMGHYLLLKSGKQKHRVGFVPIGGGSCERTAYYLCDEEGSSEQQRIDEYLESRIVKLSAGAGSAFATFSPPVRPDEVGIGMGFGAPGSAGFHTGMDFPITDAPPHVRSISGGKVLLVQRESGGCRPRENGQDCWRHGSGNVVVIEHELAEGPLYSLYANLDTIPSSIKEGSDIKQGTVLGQPCNELHFEMKVAPTLENPIGGTACEGEPCWAYVPNDPERFGYRDPRKYGLSFEIDESR